MESVRYGPAIASSIVVGKAAAGGTGTASGFSGAFVEVAHPERVERVRAPLRQKTEIAAQVKVDAKQKWIFKTTPWSSKFVLIPLVY